MKPLKTRLKELDSPIRVSIIGIGSIGKGLVYQCYLTKGFLPIVICDINLERAVSCAKWLKIPFEIVSNTSELAKALERGKLAVCQDGTLAAGADGVDVLIEASNAVLPGAMHAKRALETGKHVIMMNFEAELMYGSLLLDLARSKGLVYSCADGDQPTAIKQLLDDIEFWGFEPVMLGNIKGFYDRYTNPTKIAPEADKRNLDHKMCASYTDGSKLSVEMASLANATNARVHCPGMLGPRMNSIYEIFNHFDFDALWKSGDPPLVDYVVGAKPSGGVFTIGYTEDAFQQFTLSWFPPDMGPGPFYLFYRPYHLGHIEALKCVAEAYLDGSARLAPHFGIKTNVFCYAKQDLEPGSVLDGMGGYLTYGFIENVEENNLGSGVPQLICDGLRLKKAVKKDERIALADCEYEETDSTFSLYRESLAIGHKLAKQA